VLQFKMGERKGERKVALEAIVSLYELTKEVKEEEEEEDKTATQDNSYVLSDFR
jgi:hypothetical protein